MALNLGEIARAMLDAALPILRNGAADIEAFAKGEFQKIAQQLVTIESELLGGQITEGQAGILINMQKGASRSVLLTAQGLSMLAVEEAINAAFAAVKGTINGALGIVLL